jgi:hypothetical protein
VYQFKQASWVRQEVEAYKQEVRLGLGFKGKGLGWNKGYGLEVERIRPSRPFVIDRRWRLVSRRCVDFRIKG